ncbi:MAG: YlxR family protein [Blautia sp.]|nr:YlxR family protein [Blautia sp.]
MKTIKKIPMRQCTGCREMKPKKEMLRVIRTSEGSILLDPTGKQNGRGAYVCRSRECLEKAVRNHGLERSFKAPVPTAVYEKLKEAFDRIEGTE